MSRNIDVSPKLILRGSCCGNTVVFRAWILFRLLALSARKCQEQYLLIGYIHYFRSISAHPFFYTCAIETVWLNNQRIVHLPRIIWNFFAFIFICSYLKSMLFVPHMVTTIFLPSRIFWLGIPVWFSSWILFTMISSGPKTTSSDCL